MPVTLAQMSVGVAEHEYLQAIIDEFRRNSVILNALTFDNAVAMNGSGSTLTYGYLQLSSPSTAAKRDINGEYIANEAVKTKKSVDLAIIGGSYQIDRVIALASPNGVINEVTFQSEQKTKATINKFNYLMINGVKATDGYDGLSALLTAASRVTTSTLDVSGAMTAAKAEELVEALDTAISDMSREPDFIIANGKTLNKIKAAGRMLSYITPSEDAFGKPVTKYGNSTLLDLGKYYNGSASVDICADGDIYFVCFGMEEFHGVSPLQNEAFINAIAPDFETEGAVHKGEIEMVTAVVLKNTLAAKKITGITITAA